MECICDCKLKMCDLYYECSIISVTIAEPGTKLSIPQGNHRQGLSDKDVTSLCISCQQKVEYMPAGLGELFPNLKSLHLFSCRLSRITKNDLIGLKNLEKIRIEYTPIKYIPGDLFEYTRNMKEIWFEFDIDRREPLIPSIEKGLINGLEKLEKLRILYNHTLSKSLSYNVQSRSVQKEFVQIQSELRHFLPTNDQKNMYDEEARQFEEIVKKRSNSHPTNSVMKKTEVRSKAFKSFLESGRFADMKIIIEDETFKVHKLVLGAQSSVLADIFEKNEDVKELNLKEIKKETFEVILNFIYKDELPAADANYLDLYSACAQLKMVELMQICEERIKVGEENVDEVVSAANKFGSQKLKDKASEVIQKMFSARNVSKNLIENPEDLKKVLEMKKSLNIILEKYSAETI